MRRRLAAARGKGKEFAMADGTCTPAEALATAALALARRFAGGATLWCVAPAVPHHAEHVAVEFVHPVVMGTVALPAVAVTDPDPLGALRPVVRPGDALAVIGPPAPAIPPLLRRAEVWGLETVWIGGGDRPPPGLVRHPVWVTDDPADAAAAGYDGRWVLHYHMLWELTHVCFEHPGLLSDAPAGPDSAHCVTCSDAACVAEVVASAGGGGVVVRTGEGEAVVDASLIEVPDPGDLVLVHAGTVLERVPEEGG